MVLSRSVALVLYTLALFPFAMISGDGTANGKVSSSGNPDWRPAVSDHLLDLLGIRREEGNSTYLLPTLLYDYDGLEPYMSERTVRVHHTGHHAAYTSK